ncbi:MAG: N-acetylmuramoyl-L-alanine amidase [Campylobacteraceae bacterium]|jgi:N-acetylmuramoyl-L-alanine amidase|nr:N-acetylmuramoyl-L-alanine amidase [Campylobacteraceae bacterium]
MTIKRLILALLTALSFLFASQAEFDSFDKNFAGYSAAEKEKAYGAMQHIYINAIMDGDDKLKYEALKRIVKASKELNYDSETYEKELNTLVRLNPKLNSNFVYVQYVPPTVKKPQKEQSVVFPADMVKVQESKSTASAQTTPKPQAVPKPQTTPKQQTTPKPQSAPKPQVAPTPQSAKKPSKALALLSTISQNGENIVFSFDRALDEGDVKSFTLKTDGTVKYVYDISALRGNATDNIKTQLKDVRFSQFNQNTTRIVFESQKEINIARKIVDSKLTFTAKEFASAPVQSDKTTTVTPPPAATTVSIQKKTIVIDAGHGGRDGGATYDKKYLEKEAVLQIALALGKELEKRGHKIFYTRQSDKFLKLQQRTKIANDKNADIFISIHANAAPQSAKADDTRWQGIETFFLSPSDSQRSKNAAELENQSDVEEMDFYSKSTFLNFLNREKIIASHKLALDIQRYTLSSVKKKYEKVVDGGVREAPFWVLTGAQMPAVLLEVGYITNKTDRERMFDKNFQQVLASGVADGIVSYFSKNNR